MKITGSCHCGKVAFEAEVDPGKAGICHCTDCQKLSGSAFRTIVLSIPGTFRLLRGEVKEYVKTGESGNPRPQGFCPDCGTPIWSTIPGGEPKVYSIRVGTLDQRDELVPRLQIWGRSRLHWLDGLGAIPCVETQPVLGPTGDME